MSAELATSSQFSSDPAHTAVLSMDLQTSLVSIFAKEQEAFLARAASVLRHASSRGMRVIHVQVGFREGLPEVNPRNTLLNAIRISEQRRKMFQGEAAAIHPAVAPEGDDVVVTKHRVSAFAGTDLEILLRARDIHTLVLFGISTSGVVLSTWAHASDADYRLAIIHDCCLDRDAEVHSCLVNKVFPRQATVFSAGEFLLVP